MAQFTFNNYFCYMKRLLLIITLTFASVCSFALQPERGYRAFIDWSNYLDLNIGFISGNPGHSKVFTGLTTSHGYQFNSWLYVGGGAGLQYNLDWKKYGNNNGECRFVIPVFAETRMDARWHRFTPYISLQLGANLSDHGGIYCSPTVGYRFNWGHKSAINLGMGASIYSRRYTYNEHIVLPEGGIIEGLETHYRGTSVKFTVRLGFEFQLP